MRRTTRAAGIHRSMATAFTDQDDAHLLAIMTFLSDKTHFPRAALLAAQPHLKQFFTFEQLVSRYQQHFDVQRFSPSSRKPLKGRRTASCPERRVVGFEIQKRNAEGTEEVMRVLRGESKGKGEEDGDGDVSMGGTGEESASESKGSSYGTPVKKRAKKMMLKKGGPVKKVLKQKKGDVSKLYRDEGLRGFNPRVERRASLAAVYERYEARQIDGIGQREATVKDYGEEWMKMEAAALERSYKETLQAIVESA